MQLTQTCQQNACNTQTPPLTIVPEAEERMLTYDWKGNLRELRNAIERIVLLEEGEEIRPHHLEFLRPTDRSQRRSVVRAPQTAPDDDIEIEESENVFTLSAEGVVLDDLNKDLIQQALALTDGNQVRAAKLLELTRGTLRYRLDKYGLEA